MELITNEQYKKDCQIFEQSNPELIKQYKLCREFSDTLSTATIMDAIESGEVDLMSAQRFYQWCADHSITTKDSDKYIHLCAFIIGLMVQRDILKDLS